MHIVAITVPKDIVRVKVREIPCGLLRSVYIAVANVPEKDVPEVIFTITLVQKTRIAKRIYAIFRSDYLNIEGVGWSGGSSVNVWWGAIEALRNAGLDVRQRCVDADYDVRPLPRSGVYTVAEIAALLMKSLNFSQFNITIL